MTVGSPRLAVPMEKQRLMYDGQEPWSKKIEGRLGNEASAEPIPECNNRSGLHRRQWQSSQQMERWAQKSAPFEQQEPFR